MKTQTLIIYPNDDVALRMDDFLYQPKRCIIINNNEYFEWEQYDDLDESGILVRKILLKPQ